jgi:dTDP-4-amino-4,6-dideoxygalactose transaminase
MSNSVSRRDFIRTASASTLAVGCLGAPHIVVAETAKPALLGGKPVHEGGWGHWPHWNPAWEPEMLKVFRSGKWFRGSDSHVEEFERGYADLIGAKRCLATASGTTALMVALHVLGVDAGDEVVVSPYTFIASYNAILGAKALPVFADTNPATLTMDPASLESRITERTRAIMPVHIFGMSCDMDPILEVARQQQLRVVEDACQAWLAEYKGRKCGTLGDLGCFSFQESKHIPSGEGGAITAMSDELIDKCNSYHNCGRACGTNQGSGYFTRGNNYRLTQAQAVLLMQQFNKLVRETAVRRENADLLSSQLREIPGITVVRLPENSRPAWHLYPFRYDREAFNGLPIQKFARAMAAEGVPCGPVYHEQYFDGLLDEAISSRGFKRLWPVERLKAYRESFNELKGNKTVCETTLAMTQNMLLAERPQMDQIVEAVRKIQTHSADLTKMA